MHLDFCCNIKIVWSQFGVNVMKVWIHPALYIYSLLVLREI